MADTPPPTVTLPRTLTPNLRTPAVLAAQNFGRVSFSESIVDAVWAALLAAADQAEAAS